MITGPVGLIRKIGRNPFAQHLQRAYLKNEFATDANLSSHNGEAGAGRVVDSLLIGPPYIWLIDGFEISCG